MNDNNQTKTKNGGRALRVRPPVFRCLTFFWRFPFFTLLDKLQISRKSIFNLFMLFDLF